MMSSRKQATGATEPLSSVFMTAAKHTANVSGAYSTSDSTIAEAGPIISFSHCLFYERNRGIDVSAESQLPYRCSCAQIWRVEILGWSPLRLESACQDIVSVFGNIHTGFRISQSTC